MSLVMWMWATAKSVGRNDQYVCHLAYSIYYHGDHCERVSEWVSEWVSGPFCRERIVSCAGFIMWGFFYQVCRFYHVRISSSQDFIMWEFSPSGFDQSGRRKKKEQFLRERRQSNSFFSTTWIVATSVGIRLEPVMCAFQWELCDEIGLFFIYSWTSHAVL